MITQIVSIYTGAGLAVPASNVLRVPSVRGTILGVYLDMPSNVTGTALFSLKRDGVEIVANASLRITTGNSNVTVAGLSITMALGSVLSLDLESPLPATLPDPPWSLVITYDDGVVGGSSGGGGIGEDGADGDMGPPGPRGADGAAGSAGATGPAGAVGLSGDDGVDGEAWMIPGPVGPQGDAGATGATLPGLPGATGEDGAEGESWMIPGVPGPTGPGSVGKQTIYIPASAMIPATTNGPASAQLESTTNKLNYSVLDFDGTTQEFAHFQVAFPKSWDESTITFKAFWTTTNASTNGVAWGLQGIAASDGDTVDTAFGTAIYVVDNGQTSAALQYISAESGAVTIGGTPAAGDIVYFRVTRDPANVSDDMTQDARLVGIQVFYTTDAVNDA